MPQPYETDQRARFSHGWSVLAASFVILFFSSGARNSFGVMFKPMSAEFGWNRGDISLAFFVNMILFALSLMVVGRFYDRYGPKWVIVISTLFLSAGYILLSRIGSLGEFYVSFGVLAAVGLGGTSPPLFSALVCKYFVKWRGLAISLALSGNCLGQFAIVPLFTAFSLKHGWRAPNFYLGFIMLALNITLAFLVFRGDLEDRGKRSAGLRETGRIRQKERLAEGDLSLREAMRTPSLWFFAAAMFVCGSGDFFVTTHLIPFVTDHGVSAITAGNMLAWFGLMSLPGILIAGPASDVIGNKIPIALTFLLRVFLFLLILRHQTTLSFYVFSLLFGFTLLITAPLSTTLLGRLYGFSNIGLISAFVVTVHNLGGGLWTYMGGVVFDWTGSYRSIFIFSSVMALVAFLFTLLVQERRHLRPEKKVGTKQ